MAIRKATVRLKTKGTTLPGIRRLPRPPLTTPAGDKPASEPRPTEKQ
jgi:hypothetical protein